MLLHILWEKKWLYKKQTRDNTFSLSSVYCIMLSNSNTKAVYLKVEIIVNITVNLVGPHRFFFIVFFQALHLLYNWQILIEPNELLPCYNNQTSVNSHLHSPPLSPLLGFKNNGFVCFYNVVSPRYIMYRK